MGSSAAHAASARKASVRKLASLAAIALALCTTPALAQRESSPAPAATATAPADSQTPAVQAAPAPSPTAPLARTAPPASYQPPAAPAAFSLLQTLFALCLVLALLAGLAWLLKRVNPRGMGGSANLRVVSALALGGRERVLVVEVGDQWIVVGAAPGRVNLLTTMPKQEGVAPPPGAMPGVPAGFADWLKQTLEKRNAK